MARPIPHPPRRLLHPTFPTLSRPMDFIFFQTFPIFRLDFRFFFDFRRKFAVFLDYRFFIRVLSAKTLLSHSNWLIFEFFQMLCTHIKAEDCVERVPKGMFRKKQDMEDNNLFLEGNSNRGKVVKWVFLRNLARKWLKKAKNSFKNSFFFQKPGNN